MRRGTESRCVGCHQSIKMYLWPMAFKKKVCSSTTTVELIKDDNKTYNAEH